LQETETERENFVAEFVKPVEKTLKDKGFSFSMKARTKSISFNLEQNAEKKGFVR
jgi:GTP diphosphokinase / guanosine-3',5'-bis(diphosphate) 3'-diphosphatase